MTFNKVKSRNALARFLVKDEQPFSVVDGEGFRDFVQVLQPKFDIPGRMTVSKDVLKLFSEEGAKLKKELTKCGQRVCLTTDCWTFCTQMAYMCLIAHYIDSDWHLHKKIVNFGQIENHKGETIGKVIETCLLSWGLERVLSVTVDNASANDVAIGYVKKRINAWKGRFLMASSSI